MTWRLAKSLDTLRKQINTLSPNRSKISDGTIGDAKHASRSSDHNPHIMDGKTGVVTGLDITHDPAHGIDARKLAESLLASRDARIKYIISNGEIASGARGPSPWVWRKYSGSNPHTKHVHLSVLGEKALYDATADWVLPKVSEAKANKPVVAPKNPLLKRGSKGEDVKRLQKLLGLVQDGSFGVKTEAAVKAFQLANGLGSDGRVGPYTWDALTAKKPAKAAPVPVLTAGHPVTTLKPEDILPAELAGKTMKAGLIGSVVGGIAVDVLTDVLGKVLRGEAKNPDRAITQSDIPDLLEKLVGAAAPAIATEIAPNTQKTVDAVVKNLANEEPWYQSRVVIGLVVTGLGLVAQVVGAEFAPEDKAALVELIAQGAQVLGGFYSLYGRLFAKKLKPLGE